LERIASSRGEKVPGRGNTGIEQRRSLQGGGGEGVGGRAGVGNEGMEEGYKWKPGSRLSPTRGVLLRAEGPTGALGTRGGGRCERRREGLAMGRGRCGERNRRKCRRGREGKWMEEITHRAPKKKTRGQEKKEN